MSILLKHVLLNGKQCDIAIRQNRISEIGSGIHGDFETVINGSGKAAFPPFYNMHCHAAMTLLRGIADDMELFDWLNNHIWPAEGRLTPEDIYWGTRLACLEMIKSGTVYFNDMYFHPHETVRAVQDSGIRAAIGMIYLDASPQADLFKRHNSELWEKRNELGDRIRLTYAPHAIYTVEEKTLEQIAELSAEQNVQVHIHLAETAREYADCMDKHNRSPVAYLDSLGLLSKRLLAAHSVHLTDDDVELIREREVHTVFMPCSNYKLSSGKFRFNKLSQSGCHVTFGTDGCASNNNLSMFDEMKFGALAAKLEYGGPTACSSAEIFYAATQAGAEAAGFDAGIIQTGKLADIMLVDLDSPMMVADHNLISNLVYAADSSCVSSLICNGKILMHNRIVEGEKEILEQARKCARHLLGK